MGHAAYNRGTQVIRRQTDAEILGNRAWMDARHERETARETIDALRKENEQIFELCGAIALLREELEQANADALAAAKIAISQNEDNRQTINDQRLQLRTLWKRTNKLNAIAVTFRTMHPEQYADIRQHAEELYPNTFKK